MDNNRKILNIGIDLGTSRSVIACDNGVRTFVPSYVGFPKDAVSRKMLGRDIVFGEDAIKHRLALDLYRPFDKGKLKYTEIEGKSDEEIELSNDYIIRRTAVDYSLPLITNLQCANLFVKSLCTVDEKDIMAKAWDEFFK